MTRVIMDAFGALSPEQTQAVKDHQKSAGHKGQLRAVLMHRCEPERQYQAVQNWDTLARLGLCIRRRRCKPGSAAYCLLNI